MATVYTQTDNYGLNLYGDDDPADLRDGHNANMLKIDAAFKTHSDEIALKANSADVYTKTQVDTSQAAQDAIIATKANSADVYTKTESDTALATKANSADVYTKTESDTALATKANSADVYTKAESDTALATKANSDDVYTKTEIDGKISYQTISGEPTVVEAKYYYGDLRRYGISPNTDITALLNSAFTFASSNKYDILIPVGTYNISDVVIMPDGGYGFVGIFGRATLLKTAPSTVRITGDNIKVRNIAITGTGADSGDGMQIYGSYNSIYNCVFTQNHHGFTVDGSQGKGTTADDTYMHGDLNYVSHCESSFNGSIGFCSNDTNRCCFDTCYSHDNAHEGVTSDHTTNSKIVNCVIDNNCTNGGGAGGISTDNTVHVIISNNLIQGTQQGRTGIKFNNMAGPTSYSIITNNVIRDNTSYPIDGLSPYNVDNSIIAGNVCHGNAVNNIAFIGNSQAPFNFPPATMNKPAESGLGSQPGSPNTDLSAPAATRQNWFTYDS